jgi:hypothetical protein
MIAFVSARSNPPRSCSYAAALCHGFILRRQPTVLFGFQVCGGATQLGQDVSEL